MRQIEERVALVTGATSGLGVEIAQRLATDGLRVVVSGRSAERGASVVADLGPTARFVRADLVEPGAPQRLVDDVLAGEGRLDVLVNNAAIDHTGPLLDVPDHEVRQTFETNTLAAIACLQAAGRAMRLGGRGGAIVNVTSRLASIGVPTMAVYSASKGALLHSYVNLCAMSPGWPMSSSAWPGRCTVTQCSHENRRWLDMRSEAMERLDFFTGSWRTRLSDAWFIEPDQQPVPGARPASGSRTRSWRSAGRWAVTSSRPPTRWCWSSVATTRGRRTRRSTRTSAACAESSR